MLATAMHRRHHIWRLQLCMLVLSLVWVKPTSGFTMGRSHPPGAVSGVGSTGSSRVRVRSYQYPHPHPAPARAPAVVRSMTTPALSLDDDDAASFEDEDSQTVTTVNSPSGHQRITLIGTAHLSKKSNQQVQRLIQDIQPNVVLVELDPTRLHRIGIRDISDIQVPRVVTSEDIVLPIDMNKRPTTLVGWLIRPFWILQEVLTESFSRIARFLLTGMYNDMSDKMDNPEGGGGEFLAAIRAAEKVPDCSTLILGDRSSVTTIKRAASLAIQSGDPLGVITRLQDVNEVEMRQLEAQVRARLQEEAGESDDVDDVQMNVAMMESLKEDSQFRNRLFRKLEQEVPEFTQAFLKERDYIMAEAIRRELNCVASSSDESAVVERVVAVVGLAHVSGMAETLRAMFANETVPLLKTQS
jgi:pheromone shutdown protein TraB